MEKLSVFEQLCFSTTRIEAIDDGGQVHSGTGFFFNLAIEEGVIPFVVTNKHLVENMKSWKIRMTRADANGSPSFRRHITIQLDITKNSWLFHPDEKVDLCLLPIHVLLDASKKIAGNPFYTPLSNNLIPDSKVISNLDAVENITMIGYPLGIWDKVNNMPIVRRGITATPYRLDYEGKKEFLIDAACIPGSSGSPVFVCDVGIYGDKFGQMILGGSRVYLLGILYAGPQMHVTGDIKVTTIPTAQRKILSVTNIPINLGKVIKSERLLDFIPLIKERFQKEQK